MGKGCSQQHSERPDVAEGREVRLLGPDLRRAVRRRAAPDRRNPNCCNPTEGASTRRIRRLTGGTQHARWHAARRQVARSTTGGTQHARWSRFRTPTAGGTTDSRRIVTRILAHGRRLQPAVARIAPLGEAHAVLVARREAKVEHFDAQRACAAHSNVSGKRRGRGVLSGKRQGRGGALSEKRDLSGDRRQPEGFDDRRRGGYSAPASSRMLSSLTSRCTTWQAPRRMPLRVVVPIGKEKVHPVPAQMWAGVGRMSPGADAGRCGKADLACVAVLEPAADLHEDRPGLPFPKAQHSTAARRTAAERGTPSQWRTGGTDRTKAEATGAL